MLLRNPITGIAGCCARATSGQATAAPPKSDMNSRRLLSNMELPAPWVIARVGHRTSLRPGVAPERPNLHEVTISHPPGVDFSAQCRARLPGQAANRR